MDELIHALPGLVQPQIGQATAASLASGIAETPTGSAPPN
jgi:hypothetical protein